MRLRHLIAGSVPLLGSAWTAGAPHPAASRQGGLAGYVIGRRSGRRREVPRAAREVVAEGSPVLRPDADPEAPDPETVTRPRPH